MKNKVAVAILALAALSLSVPSHADRYLRAQNDNPFRIIGYALYPVGLLAEYAIMRPIHWAVSQPNTDILFGHQTSKSDEGTFFEWTHGDYSPSIAEERRTAQPERPQPRPAMQRERVTRTETKETMTKSTTTKDEAPMAEKKHDMKPAERRANRPNRPKSTN